MVICISEVHVEGDPVNIVFRVDRKPTGLSVGASWLLPVGAVEGEIPWVVVRKREAK